MSVYTLIAISLATTILVGCITGPETTRQQTAAAKPACSIESFPHLPDVTITSVSQETQFAPHCKVAGVIGPEIHFELLLPNEWNGKFVMGGGGGQALMEAQRYSEDFDGIVSGAPAYNWPMLGTTAIQVNQIMYPDPNDIEEAVVGPKEQELIESSYLKMCDEADGRVG